MSNKIVKALDDETILELFGAQAAEDERPDRLKAYFIRNKTYERAQADIPLRIVVGHKGIGKSALLKILYLEDMEKEQLSIWLQPNDIARAWSVDGSFLEKVEGIKKNILSIIAEKAFDRLQVFGKGVKDIKGISTARNLFRRLTRFIQDADGASLEAGVAKEFMKSGRVKIYVDDIDRGWAATQKDIENISALINAARDLTNHDEDRLLQFKIGIRTDAYNLVREHDESGDKFEPYIIPVHWSNHEILVLMAKRVANFFGEEFDDDIVSGVKKVSQRDVSKYLYPVLTERFEGAGHWSNRAIHHVLLSLTRQRPRDLVD